MSTQLSQTIQIQKPKRSLFDMSYERKTTIKMGDLVPVHVQEVLPSDTISLSTQTLVKFFPTIAPIMHRVDVYIHYYFVPNRLIWTEWEDFITGGKTGQLTPNLPKFSDNITNWKNSAYAKVGSLMDYMDVPVHRFTAMSASNSKKLAISQLPFRAYQKIWNEYYREVNLQDELVEIDGSINYQLGTSQAAQLLTLRKRNWEKDYFTTALPQAQLGVEATFSMSDYAPVKGAVHLGLGTEPVKWSTKEGWDIVTGNAAFLTSTDTLLDGNGSNQVTVKSGLFADLNNATALTVNQFRETMAVQRWMEKNMRSGYRYFEQILSHFAIESPDARLQRPEYLGGAKLYVQVSEVNQTSETDTSSEFVSALGTPAGKLYATGANGGFKKYFQEHGLIIGLMSVMPRTAYMDGLPRFFKKDDKFDFYWPELANLGEHEMDLQELWLTADEDNESFGYVPRYQDYRINTDKITGKMRTDFDFWHLGRYFTSKPVLNESFVQCNPSDRIFPLEDGSYEELLVQLYQKIYANRPVAKWGIPY